MSDSGSEGAGLLPAAWRFERIQAPKVCMHLIIYFLLLASSSDSGRGTAYAPGGSMGGLLTATSSRRPAQARRQA